MLVVHAGEGGGVGELHGGLSCGCFLQAVEQPYTVCEDLQLDPGRGMIRRVPSGDRLTALDTSFLHLEAGGAHMHVASVMTFEGEAPEHDELVEAIEDRLHLVPRYRQRLAEVPLGQGRPIWVDDPHFNAALPHPPHRAARAGRRAASSRRLAGRVFAQRAGPLQAAVGDLARRGPRGRPLRAHVEDPPRARRRRLRRRHRHGAVRHVAGRRRPPHRRREAGSPGPPRAGTAARRGARRAPDGARARSPAACGARRARRARRWTRSSPGSPASARWPGPACARRPPSP